MRGLTGFGRQVAGLATGTMIGQLITLAATPLLTRQYTPAQFGAYGVVLAVVSTVSVFASGRYELAVVVADDDDEAAAVLAASLGVLLIVGTAVGAASAGALVALGTMRGSGAVEVVAAVLVAIAGYGVYQSMTYWLMRRNCYGSLSSSRVTIALVTGGVSLCLGLARMNTGLLWGYAAGVVAGCVHVVLADGGNAPTAVRQLGRGAVKRSASKFRRFPLANAPHALVDGLRDNAVMFLMSGAFGPSATGYLSLAQRAARMPTSLVGSAVSQVFFRHASLRRQSGESVTRLATRTMRTLALWGALPFAALAVFGPQLFSLAFGARWLEAGRYVQILTPWLYAVFVVSPVTTIPAVTGRLGTAFAIVVGETALRIGAMLGVTLLGFGAQAAVVALSVVGTLTTSLTGWWLLTTAKRSDAAPLEVTTVAEDA